MTNLTTFVLYYSLFQKELFDNKKEIMKYFPANVFGVFTTVRRAIPLKTYPTDVHGCIGFWDNDFKVLSPESLYRHLLRVSHDSVWKDERRRFFGPIEREPETILEIDFMLNPIYSIHPTTGMISVINKRFSNKRFGIIIQRGAQKATYLPNVFPDISWKELVISIKEKAGITSDDFELFAYKIHQIKSTYSTILTSALFTYISVHHFSRLLIGNMNVSFQFPFAYSYKQSQLEWNATDQVRNISTLSDIFRYATIYKGLATKQELKAIKQKIINILKEIDKYTSQALSFLGFMFQSFRLKSTPFCQKLLSDLPNAEREFEKPEIIIGLNKAGCKKEKEIPTLNPTDSIFRMNWAIQQIISYKKKPSMEDIAILKRKIADILLNKGSTETNYLAVAFESLCFAYKPTLLHMLFELFFELEQRKNCNHTLYSFLDKTSRIDITGHVLNGLVQLSSP
jgi:AMMECR1 domain-containing protein